MISENLSKKISYQINREIFSAYLYLGMGAYADSIGLKGFANWFKRQFNEEMFHAQKMCDYLNEQSIRVVMEAIEKPPQDFGSAKELFEKTLAHEKNVTKLINNLMDMAKQENDLQSQKMLEWFVKEQKEEEEIPAHILKSIEEAGESEEGLLKVDSQLGTRK